MPGWLKDYINYITGPAAWLFRWGLGVTEEWLHWVNVTLPALVMFVYRSYILLTYDIANFSYYVGSFAQAMNGYIVDIRYNRIPSAIITAEKYAYAIVEALKDWTQKKLDDLRTELLADLAWVYKYLLKLINAEVAARIKAIADLQAFLVALIIKVSNELSARIDRERAERRKEIHLLRVWARQQFANIWAYAKTILPTVDKEAAAGYNSTRSGQADLFTKLLDDLAIDNPLVKDVVARLATIVIDLVSVDDPLLRIAAQFIVTQVIDRLGLDKLAAGLISDLLHQFLGAGPPKTLQDVTASIGNRLNTQEQQWQQFYANGGDDLERLGDQMRESSNPLFTLGMAGFFAGAVADPTGTAAAADAVVTPAAELILGPLTALLGV